MNRRGAEVAEILFLTVVLCVLRVLRGSFNCSVELVVLRGLCDLCG